MGKIGIQKLFPLHSSGQAKAHVRYTLGIAGTSVNCWAACMHATIRSASSLERCPQDTPANVLIHLKCTQTYCIELESLHTEARHLDV